MRYKSLGQTGLFVSVAPKQQQVPESQAPNAPPSLTPRCGSAPLVAAGAAVDAFPDDLDELAAQVFARFGRPRKA
ncbi:MAG TPA: hypothetical protein VIW26_04650 [Gemmatimonadales bacterium]|jgi:hypothetical protein